MARNINRSSSPYARAGSRSPQPPMDLYDYDNAGGPVTYDAAFASSKQKLDQYKKNRPQMPEYDYEVNKHLKSAHGSNTLTEFGLPSDFLEGYKSPGRLSPRPPGEERSSSPRFRGASPRPPVNTDELVVGPGEKDYRYLIEDYKPPKHSKPPSPPAEKKQINLPSYETVLRSSKKQEEERVEVRQTSFESSTTTSSKKEEISSNYTSSRQQQPLKPISTPAPAVVPKPAPIAPKVQPQPKAPSPPNEEDEETDEEEEEDEEVEVAPAPKPASSSQFPSAGAAAARPAPNPAPEEPGTLTFAPSENKKFSSTAFDDELCEAARKRRFLSGMSFKSIRGFDMIPIWSEKSRFGGGRIDVEDLQMGIQTNSKHFKLLVDVTGYTAKWLEVRYKPHTLEVEAKYFGKKKGFVKRFEMPAGTKAEEIAINLYPENGILQVFVPSNES